MIEHSNIFYIRDLSQLGGVEQFEYELATKYKDLDIAIVYKTADNKQLDRLKKLCFCYKHKGQQIKCDVAIINYDISIIDYINKEAKIYEVCHGDYHNKAYKWKMPTHDRIYKYIGITKKIEQNLIEDVGKDKTIQIYNPLTIPKSEKPLILMSATRLSPIKGKQRMIKLAKELDNSGINYVWFIFTNDKDAIYSPNVVYMKPTLDIDKWYDMADMLVQLSDTEACSYAINQMLYRNKPVIVTPLPYLEEIGVKDGINAHILEFNCSNIQEVVKNITKPLKFEFKRLEDNYDKILKKSKSHYEEDMMKNYKVKATRSFTDTVEEKHRVKEDEFLVNKERYEFLKEHNAVELIEVIVPKVEKKKEDKELMKELTEKATKKNTKKK